MLKKSTLLHLRLPFSFFLLPVFLLAGATSSTTHSFGTLTAFVILHLLVYPASNGYNSYFDKDEGSIGGLKHPPKVSVELYRTSLILDVIALLLGLLISWEFSVLLFVYGMVSKAYSHPSVRLKKKPITGWLTAGVFQGYFTYLLSYIAINDISVTSAFTLEIQLPGILSSIMLLGSYPMTQVYQHEEDSRRGDRTISILLGVRGTFHFTMILFTVAVAGFNLYFANYFNFSLGITFNLALSPVLIFFLKWYLSVRKDPDHADFDRTMRLNFISSLCLNAFFLYWWIFW